MKISGTLSIFVYLVQVCFSTEVAKKTDEEHAKALISWLKKEGGYFNPKLEMRRVDPSDPTSFFGMFAKDSIPEEELLLRIPRTMVLDSREEEPDIDIMTCSTVRNLIDQLKLRDDSKYAPYVNYLLDTQPPGSIPSAWSESGKALFTRVLQGPNGDYPIELPLMSDPFPWVQYWHESCNGSNDPLEEYAALIVIQRSWDDLLIPVFDLMSHRNGVWLNTMHTPVHGDVIDIKVKAKRDIEANEQIYTSYNMCESCGNRVLTYGTPEILREYGFVEQMPQSFTLHNLEFGFRVNQKHDENGQPVGKAFITQWILGEPDDYDAQLLSEMLDQVKRSKNEVLNTRDVNVIDFEWQTINNYVDALLVAFEAAVEAASNQDEILVFTDDSEDEEYYEVDEEERDEL